MNKVLKQYSEKMQKEFEIAIASKKFQEAITKNLEDSNGRFEVVASIATPDRIGDVILETAWDFVNYKKNPVILWGHDYSIPPIGKATGWRIEGKKLIIEGIFASNPLAQQVRKDYESGFQKAVSIGGIIKKRSEDDFDVVEEIEFLELSFVSVGMHQDAIDNLKKTMGGSLVEALLAKEIITLDAEIDKEEEPIEEVSDAPDEVTKKVEEEVVETGEDKLTEEEKAFVKMAEKLGFQKVEKCGNHEEEPDEEEDEEEEKAFTDMDEEEKAIFMHELQKGLQKSVGNAQEFLRDWKRKDVEEVEDGDDDVEDEEEQDTEE